MLNPVADQKSKRQIIATIQLTCEGCDWIYTNGDSVKLGSILGLFNTSVFTESIIRHWLNTLGDAFWQNQSITMEAVRHHAALLLLHNGRDYIYSPWSSGCPSGGDNQFAAAGIISLSFFTLRINGSRFIASWTKEINTE